MGAGRGGVVLQQPGEVELRHEMLVVLLDQEVLDLGSISPRRPDVRSRLERGVWPDELSRREG